MFSGFRRVLATVSPLIRHNSSAAFGNQTSASSLFDGIIRNERGDLARAITLIESSHAEKHKEAQILLDHVLQRLQEKRNLNEEPCLRIGFTGPPGAGKSSLIETFGKYLTSQGIRVAVLTVDPSSTTTGGSILGDKVRMSKLAVDPLAFIRSSPNKCTLGGVTRTTLETILLCEAANFNVVLVETVGVGQAEHAVVNIVDCMVLLIPPGSGDEWQGLKKGISELADIVAISKYDSHFEQEARRLKSEYMSATKYIRQKSRFWRPKVTLTSASTNVGIDNLWSLLCEYRNAMIDNNEFYAKRQSQFRLWFWKNIKENLLDILLAQPTLKDKLNELEVQVLAGNITPGIASDLLVEEFKKHFI